MKKVFFSILGVAAIAGGAVFNFNTGISTNARNDVALANVEALARWEVPTADKQDYLKGEGWCCGSGKGFCTAPTPC